MHPELCVPVGWGTWPGRGRSSPQAVCRRAVPSFAGVAPATKKRAGPRRAWGSLSDRRMGAGGVLWIGGGVNILYEGGSEQRTVLFA